MEQFPLRIRAVQPLQPNVQPLPEVPGNQDQVDAAQAVAFDSFESSIRSVTEGGRTNAALLNQIASNVTGTVEAENMRRAYDSIRTGNGAGTAAVSLVSNALEAYVGFQSAREELKRRQAEEARSNGLLELAQEKELFLAEAENVLRSPEHGRAAYHSAANNLIEKYSGVLTPEDIIDLTTDLYKPFREFSGEEARATFGTLDQINNHTANIKEAELSILLANNTARIANSNSPAEIQDLTQAAITTLEEQVAGLNPYQRLTVTSTLLEQIGEQYGDRLGKLAEFQTEVENQQLYSRDYIQYVTPLINSGALVQAEDVEARLAMYYGVDGAQRRSDPLRSLELQNRHQTLSDNINRAARAGVISSLDAQTYTNDQIADLAFIMVNDPVRVAGFTDEMTNSSPFRSARALADAWVFVQEEGDKVNLEINRLNESIARLETANAQTIASSIPEPQQLDTLLASLSLAASFDSGLNAIVDSLVTAKDAPNNEDLQRQATQAVLDNRSSIIATLQEQAGLLVSQYEQKTGILQQYNLYSQEDFAARAAGAQVTLDGFQQRANEVYQDAQSNLGALPNFNLPDLRTVDLGEDGQAVLPFMSNVEWRSTGELGEARSQGGHAGWDLAIPEGTPIVFYTQGTVTAVKYDANGYGHYVDVKSPDGYTHRFAHNSDIQVAVGQTVYPGEVIALAGSTGRSSGPHLHWEIREPGAPNYGRFEAGGVIDPLDYTSQFTPYQDTVRDNNPVSVSENGGTYASTNKDDYAGVPGNADFGYNVLATNSAFRNKLNNVSSNLGIPTQWLADVIAFESGFDPGVWNHGGAPAVGLIQFYADKDSGGRNGYKTIGGRRYNLQDIARMSPVEQLDLVEAYMNEVRPSGGFNTPYEVLASIFGGPGLVNTLRRNPQEAARIGDGDINFGSYTRRLGEQVGRSYLPLFPEPIRTR